MQNLSNSNESVTPYISPCVSAPGQYVAPRGLSGIAASPGIIEGSCTMIRNPQDLRTLPFGTILVCEAALPAVRPFLPLLGGLIAERGGCLSIASVYAREHAIPAVFGIEGLMDALQNGDVVRVDGSRGTVEIMGESGAKMRSGM